MVERSFRSYRIQHLLQHGFGRTLRQDGFDCGKRPVLHGHQRAERPDLLLRGYGDQFVQSGKRALQRSNGHRTVKERKDPLPGAREDACFRHSVFQGLAVTSFCWTLGTGANALTVNLHITPADAFTFSVYVVDLNTLLLVGSDTDRVVVGTLTRQQ